jgi:hypothetical protein
MLLSIRSTPDSVLVLSCPTKAKCESIGRDSCRITLPAEVSQDTSLVLQFDYTLPVSAFDGAVYLDRGHRWYPMFQEQIAPYSLRIAAPADYAVIAGGNFVSTREAGDLIEWAWESPIAVFKLSFVIVPKAKLRQTVYRVDDNFSIISFAYGSKALASGSVVTEAVDLYEYFSKEIGGYPYNRLSFVELPDVPGMNIGSGIVTYDSTFAQGFALGYFDGLQLGMACQWFSASTFNEFLGRGFWFLQLSLPHYLRLQCTRDREGDSVYAKVMAQTLDSYRSIVGTEHEVSLLEVDFPNSREKGLALYAKGPYLLSLIAEQIGDEAWRKMLRDLYHDFRGRIMTLDDFLLVVGRADSTGAAAGRLERLLSEKGLPTQ